MKVLYIGDSRKMKGGISTVIKSIEKTNIWRDYKCNWLEFQINASIFIKLLYLIKGIVKGVFIVPLYDVIHFHSTPGTCMIVQLPLFLYSQLCGKKIILHLHVGNQLYDYSEDRLFRFYVTHSDCILTLGKKWMNHLKAKFPQLDKFNYIYNSVEPYPQSHRNCMNKKYFLFAAYFNINKGYDTLLAAFSKFHDTKYKDWKLVLCGAGNVREVEKYIQKYNLKDDVIMPGWVEGDAKIDLFKGAAAYCMTSLQEGLPMSVLESISYGVPIITTPVGCLPELLKDNDAALFFDYNDSDELSRCMKLIAEDPEVGDRIVRNALEAMYNNFTTDIFVKRLDNIYRNI